MTDTLVQLTAKLQALLLGDVTTFSVATCTAAIRQALKDLNINVPCHAAELVTANSGEYEYELTDGEALDIVDVLRQGTDAYNDFNRSLAFDFYFEDDRPFFRLQNPEGSTSTLIVRYTKPYTINGLDSQTVSTLPVFYDAVLLDGAAWRACLVRAAGRIETINMNANVSANFSKMAETFKTMFEEGIAFLNRRRFPTSMPVLGGGWQDEWSGHR
jgi:hypothetical protein